MQIFHSELIFVYPSVRLYASSPGYRPPKELTDLINTVNYPIACLMSASNSSQTRKLSECNCHYITLSSHLNFGYHVCFVFARSLFRYSFWGQSTLVEVFSAFRQSLQETLVQQHHQLPCHRFPHTLNTILPFDAVPLRKSLPIYKALLYYYYYYSRKNLLLKSSYHVLLNLLML
jgi:hypothetical protein